MEETNIAFCGAGFLGIYHVGVVSCLKAHAGRLLRKINKYGGCSAGALAACMLLCDINMEECVHFVMNQASKVHQSTLGPLSRNFDIVDQIRKTSAKHLPADAYQKASGKLYISLTRVSDFKNVIVSQYESNKDLIDALICTCFIPVFCGMIPPTFKGAAYIDGGLTDNLPQHFDGTTITVSPFGGENDICPDDRHKSSSQFDMKNTNVQFSCHNLYRMTRALFPPNNDVLIKMCQEGFSDTFSYLYKTYADFLSYDDSIKFSITYLLDEMMDDHNKENLSSERGSTFNNKGDSSSYMSEAEQLIATGKALQMLASPNELNEILCKTKKALESDNLNWYFFQILLTLTSWTRQPCKYTSTHILNFSKYILSSFLPKIHAVGSKSNFTQYLMDFAMKGFHAYKETAIFEWHPTIKDQDQIRIQQSKERLRSVAESLKTVPGKMTAMKTPITSVKTISESLLPGYQDDIEKVAYDEAIGNLHDDVIYFKASDGSVSLNDDHHLVPQHIMMSFEEDLINDDDDDEDNHVRGIGSTSPISYSGLSSSISTAFVSGGVKDMLGRALGYIFLKSLGLR